MTTTSIPTKDEEKPKRKRNKSAAERRILADVQGDEKTTLRYSIIRCELRHAMKGFNCKQRFLAQFDAEARAQASYRTVVGWVSNYVTLRAIESGNDIPDIQKQLYDRVWSSIDSWRKHQETLKASKTEVFGKAKKVISGKADKVGPEQKKNNHKDYYSSMLEEFLQVSGLNLMDLPPIVPFEMRSPTTRDMAVAALNHITINLEKRIKAYILHQIANLLSASNMKTKLLRKIAGKLTTLAMNGMTVLPETFDTLSPKIDRTEIQEVMAKIGRTFQSLGVPNEKAKEKFMRDNAHFLLPILYQISTTFEMTSQKARIIIDNNRNLPKSIRRVKNMNEFRKNGLLLYGKPFSILPYWALQPVFVDYSETQLQTMFGKDYAKIEAFEDQVFDLSRIMKGKGVGWKLMGFRTNGVELHVRIGTLKSRNPAAKNSESLKKAGYQIPRPSKLVDVAKEERGVYRISQSRFDNRITKKDEHIHLVTVDPGISNVLTVRETLLKYSSTVEEIQETSQTWSISNDEWKEMTKYELSRTWENKRRQGRSMYPWLLKRLRTTRKKTCVMDTFINYVATYSPYIRVMMRELTKRSRRVTRYLVAKNTQRAMSALANRLCLNSKDPKSPKRVIFYGDGSFRAKKGHASVPAKAVVRACAQRALTFSEHEFGSSKYCPQCGCEMKNVKGKHRIRRCTSDPTAASPCIFSASHIDRDDSATISLTLCASQALLSHTRPLQFCRPASEEACASGTSSGVSRVRGQGEHACSSDDTC